MKQYALGILGAGNMGGAIARGAVQAGRVQAAQCLLFNRTEEKRAPYQAEGFAVTGDPAEVYTKCDMVVLGIKPQNFAEVLPRIACHAMAEKPLVVSIAAGVPFARMEAVLGRDTPMIRVMPNTPLMLGEGASALVKNSAATAQQLDTVRALFDTMGVTAVFDEENMINEVIPYNGSAPAYVYAFADGMVKSAVQHGIGEQDALRLICQTMIGSAKMLLKSGKSAEELTQAVCSPGGTTIEAVRVLQEKGLAEMLAEASDKCIARAYELGK